MIFSFTIVSCLGSNDPVEYPVDVTIWQFELDTIYGVNYKFTIDQINGLIYNLDSVPHTADTIINKILVKNINSPYAYPFAADTFFTGRDSINFLEGPLRLKMISMADGVTSKDYTISVRIHKQDPDSLVWNRLTEQFTSSNIQHRKTVILAENILIYTSVNDVYMSSKTDGKQWSHNSVTGLPDNFETSSVINYKNELYARTEDGKVFNSEDGIVWTESALSGNVDALIIPLEEWGTDRLSGISAIVDNKFAISNEDATAWTLSDTTVPDGFPKNNISSVSFVNRTGISRAVVVGTPQAGATQTVIWSTGDAINWAAITTSSQYSLPAMNNPSVIFYNDRLYAYGGDFENFYVSDDFGLIWKKIEKKFLFPATFKGRGDYSSLVDENNFIWFVWTGQTGKYSNEVWKGRLNKLGFDIQ